MVGVVRNDAGLYLVGERAGLEDCWQFPQGGIEQGENPAQALARELAEEIGCGDVDILGQSTRAVDYQFPHDLKSSITKRFSGQTQVWFLVRFRNGGVPDLSRSDGEFQRIEWMALEAIVTSVVAWKRPAYLDGLMQLGVWPKGKN